jgi:hypothetical protein
MRYMPARKRNTFSSSMSIRLDEALLEHLDERLPAFRFNKNALIMSLLRRGLGLPDGGPGTSEPPDEAGALELVRALADRVAEVEHELASLRALEPIVRDLARRPTSNASSPLVAGLDIQRPRQALPYKALTFADAFRLLGGDTKNRASTVPSLSGEQAVTYQAFGNVNRITRLGGYETFGFEFARERNVHGTRLLMPTDALRQRLRAAPPRGISG